MRMMKLICHALDPRGRVKETALLVLLTSVFWAFCEVRPVQGASKGTEQPLAESQSKSPQCKATFAVWDNTDGDHPQLGKLTDAQGTWVHGQMQKDYPGVCFLPDTSTRPDAEYEIAYGPADRTFSGYESFVSVAHVHPHSDESFSTWILSQKRDPQLAALIAGVNYIYTRFACKATFGVVYMGKKEFFAGELTSRQADWLEKKQPKKYPGVCFVYSTQSDWLRVPVDYIIVYGDSEFIETGTSANIYSNGSTAYVHSRPSGYDVSFVHLVGNSKGFPELYHGGGLAQLRWQDASQKALEDAVKAICWKVNCGGN